MEKKSDTYQIATDIQWEYAGDGIVRQIMGYDENLMMGKVEIQPRVPSAHSISILTPKVPTWPADALR